MSKIVFTSNTSWYLWNFRKTTIEKYIERGYRVYCLSASDKYSERLTGLGATFINTNLSQYGINPIVELLTILKVLKAIKAIKPRVVFSFTTKNNIYIALCRVFIKFKYIPNVSGLGQLFTIGGVGRLLLISAYKFCCTQASFVFFQNNEDLMYFKSRGLLSGTPHKRLLGSGVDIVRFGCKDPEIRFAQNNINFILVARLLEEKGVLLYIESAKKIKQQYPNVEFHIAGPLMKSETYPINNEYLSALNNASIIHYHGNTDNVEDLLSEMHCMVLPTYYSEGVPKSLIEALASGLAIITTRNSGCIDTVIECQNGYLVEKKDLSGLTAAIKKYIDLTTETKKQFSLVSNQLANDKFSDKKNIEEYFNAMN